MDRNFITNRRRKQQSGYVMVGVLILSALCLLITTSLLQSSTSTSKTRYVVDKNTKNFYKVEQTINAVTAWLQSNSKNIVTGFTATNFSSNFDIASPTTGSNEGSSFAVPTLVKMKGTSNAVQLTNSSYFGTSSFPTTTNIDTNASFDAVSSFQNTDFGSDINVRLLLVWATQTNGNYQPIFRVDAATGGSSPEHGVHGINFIKSALVSDTGGVGYYADLGDFQTSTPNNQCWSYQYTYNAGTNSWVRGAPRSNCLITGRDDIQIKSAIHGNVLTLKSGGINLDGGSISGTKCAGATCAVTYTLPNNPDWTTRCSGVAPVDVTSTANPQNISNGGTLATSCYRTLSAPSNKGFNFITPDTPYYIKTLDLQNNSNSTIRFPTIGSGHKYILYIDSITGSKINGNQMISTNLAPNQIEIYITKSGTLTLNGTANMNAVVTGCKDHTTVLSGNFTFNGAVRDDAVSVSGNAVLGYDEALGGLPSLSDINFTLYKASQRYR